MRTALIIIATLVLIGGVIFGYNTFFLSAEPEGSLTVTDRTDLPGGEIIAQLERLPANFDTAVFNDPAYQRLVDGTVVIEQMPTGKSNPFAPIGLPRQPRTTR